MFLYHLFGLKLQMFINLKTLPSWILMVNLPVSKSRALLWSENHFSRNIFNWILIWIQLSRECFVPGRERLFKRAPFPSYFWTVDGCVQTIVSVYSAVYSVQWCTVQSGHRCRLSDDDLSSCAGHIVLTTHPPVHSRDISRMMMMMIPHITCMMTMTM